MPPDRDEDQLRRLGNLLASRLGDAHDVAVGVEVPRRPAPRLASWLQNDFRAGANYALVYRIEVPHLKPDLCGRRDWTLRFMHRIQGEVKELTVGPGVRGMLAAVPRVLLLGIVSRLVEGNAQDTSIELDRSLKIGHAQCNEGQSTNGSASATWNSTNARHPDRLSHSSCRVDGWTESPGSTLIQGLADSLDGDRRKGQPRATAHRPLG